MATLTDKVYIPKVLPDGKTVVIGRAKFIDAKFWSAVNGKLVKQKVYFEGTMKSIGGNKLQLTDTAGTVWEINGVYAAASAADAGPSVLRSEVIKAPKTGIDYLDITRQIVGG